MSMTPEKAFDVLNDTTVRLQNVAAECSNNDLADAMREKARVHARAVATVKAHITQPAQSVDVRAIPDARPLPELMMASYHEAVGWNAYREALITRAIGNAQSVNVEAIREVIAELRSYRNLVPCWRSLDASADKLTAALQEKGNG